MSKGKRYTEYGCIDCLRLAYRRMDTALGHLHQAALRGAEAEGQGNQGATDGG